MYWVDTGTFHGIEDSKQDPHAPNHDAAVMRVPLVGGAPVAMYDGEDVITDLAIDGDTIYVAASSENEPGRIVAMSSDGTGAHAVVDAPLVRTG